MCKNPRHLIYKFTLYGARSASERTNSYDQEVIANAHPLRMRGLKASHAGPQGLSLCRSHSDPGTAAAPGAQLCA
jgi:hypothetical protein